jgi:[ribosomal protein S5]-alanine N-acetyltransferase
MISTSRFLLRPLTINDATDNYLSWLNIEISPYIAYAANNPTKETLKTYINECVDMENVLFLGIFTKNQQHIGNIKYESIDHNSKTAVMGILIGNIKWRGKGVASEVIRDSGKYLAKKFDVKNIFLGVDKENKAAIAAYNKVGFKIISQNGNSIKMVWKV